MSEEIKEVEKKWYVVRTLSGKERKVKEQLENEIRKEHYENYIPQVLIPTEKVYQVRKGKPIQKERNMFPGYILVNTALNGEIMHFIKGVKGVVGFISTEKGKIDPLREEEVIRLLGKIDEVAENEEIVMDPFIVGEHVKIIDGAFKGMSGFIEELYEDKKKLKVMVKIFERKVPVELRFMQVEKE